VATCRLGCDAHTEEGGSSTAEFLGQSVRSQAVLSWPTPYTATRLGWRPWGSGVAFSLARNRSVAEWPCAQIPKHGGVLLGRIFFVVFFSAPRCPGVQDIRPERGAMAGIQRVDRKVGGGRPISGRPRYAPGARNVARRVSTGRWATPPRSAYGCRHQHWSSSWGEPLRDDRRRDTRRGRRSRKSATLGR